MLTCFWTYLAVLLNIGYCDAIYCVASFIVCLAFCGRSACHGSCVIDEVSAVCRGSFGVQNHNERINCGLGLVVLCKLCLMKRLCLKLAHT